MPIEGALIDATTEDTLFVGADHLITFTVYQSDGVTAQNITGWTIVLDIRKKDTGASALLSKTATITNGAGGICTFTISDDDLSAAIFTGDEFEGRYSIWRKDAGSEQPLRYGDCVITRTTQATT